MVIYLRPFTFLKMKMGYNMKNNKFRNIAKVFALLLVMSVFSSCASKGVGCPNNFKVLPSISINIF